MTVTRLTKSSAKVTLISQEAEIIENAFYTYDEKLSSKIIIIWLIISISDRYDIRLGKNITMELLKDGTTATLYISSYAPKYHISPKGEKRYKVSKKKQLVCHFSDTDKLISFAKFIFSQGYQIKRDRLFSCGRRYILTIEGKIPFEAVGEFCEHYSVADSGETLSPDYSLICENGAIGIIAGI